jgi:riboflavin kinase/FMN adenylyltransferase
MTTNPFNRRTLIGITKLDDVQMRPRRVAIGQFDGVHRGHRMLIEGCDTVVTFEPHPKSIVGCEPSPPILSPLAHKARLLRSLGVRELVVVDFDDARAHQAPEDFVNEVLVRRLGAIEVSVGANFRYGHRAAGDTATLAADGRFGVRVAELLDVGGEPVSSTRIRGLIAAGELSAAADLLGSCVHLAATVRCPAPGAHFDEVGALVMFPHHSALPPAGEYGCVVGGETARLTVTRIDAGRRQVAGWLNGPAVEIRPSARLEIDMSTDLATTTLVA